MSILLSNTITLPPVSFVPAPNAIPRGDAFGKLDLRWIPTDNLTLVLRHGVDSERVGIVFSTGEAWWTTDKKQLWIGDGLISGGVPQNTQVDGATLSLAARAFI